MKPRWLIICLNYVAQFHTYFFYIHCQLKHNLAGFGLRNKFVIDKNSGKVSYNKHHKGMNRHLISHNDRI